MMIAWLFIALAATELNTEYIVTSQWRQGALPAITILIRHLQYGK